MAEKKYYWLKLQKDFFKRHDIKIIEGMPNGKDYILFYLKLLVESISHEGSLRFSDTIPYNAEMLSTITNTNVDIVKAALHIFKQLNMVELLEDETIFMTEIDKMLGSESGSAHRVRKHREQQALLGNTNVTRCNQEKEIDKELEKDKEKDIKRKRFVPPTLQEVKAYCMERHNNIDAETFIDFYESKGWMVGRAKMKDWKASVRVWEKNHKPTSNSALDDLLKENGNDI